MVTTRSVRSVRSLKRRPRVHSADYHIMRQRSRSLEQVDISHGVYQTQLPSGTSEEMKMMCYTRISQVMFPGEEWDEGRSRSLPRWIVIIIVGVIAIKELHHIIHHHLLT